MRGASVKSSIVSTRRRTPSSAAARRRAGGDNDDGPFDRAGAVPGDRHGIAPGERNAQLPTSNLQSTLFEEISLGVGGWELGVAAHGAGFDPCREAANETPRARRVRPPGEGGDGSAARGALGGGHRPVREGGEAEARLRRGALVSGHRVLL